MIKKILRRGIRKLGFDIVRYEPVRPLVFPEDFTDADRELFSHVKPYTQTSPERVKVLAAAVEHIEKHGIPGAILECGVWKGGSMMAIARTLQRLGAVKRDLYLCDTFEGMPPASAIDVDHAGNPASKYEEWYPNFNVVALENVRTNMATTGYPVERIHYVKGKVEDTLPAQAPEQIALLRLDTDWYESTWHELEYLFPRVAPHGLVIIDDYGHFQGAKKAVDEYLAASKVPLFLGRIDYTGRIIVKPF
jgi:hypothetical protein